MPRRNFRINDAGKADDTSRRQYQYAMEQQTFNSQYEDGLYNEKFQTEEWGQLEPSEQWILEHLPKVTEKVSGAWSSFQETPVGEWVYGAGKALSPVLQPLFKIMDAPAEGVERLVGLASQAHQASEDGTWGDFTNNLGSAWYAGSLGWDTMHLPDFDVKYGENGKAIGIGVTLDKSMGGAEQLSKTRKVIEDLVHNQGLSYGEALTVAKQEYDESLGILSIRAQVRDAMGHMLFDPLNYVLPILKPVERLQVLRIKALTSVDEVADLTRVQRTAIALTGGYADLVPSVWEKVGNVPGMKWLGKTFTLTPESAAREVVDIVEDAIAKRILAASDDPHIWMDEIGKLLNSSMGDEVGHMVTTIQGRAVQSFAGDAHARAKFMISAFDQAHGERRLLNAMVDALNKVPGAEPTTAAKVAKEFAEDSSGFLSRLKAKGFDTTQFSDEVIGSLVKLTDAGMPLSVDELRIGMMNMFSDIAARQAIVRFGVKPHGIFRKFINTVKSAEGLAFLKTNPTFAFKNLWNNEATLIARGVSPFHFGKVDEYIEAFGAPARVGAAFTIGDFAQEGITAGQATISRHLVGERQWLDNVRSVLNDADPIKIGKLAGVIENSASKRAYVFGHSKWMNENWRPGKGMTDATEHLSQFNPREAAKINDLMRHVKSHGEIDEVLADFANTSKRLDVNTVVDELEDALGRSLDDMYEAPAVQTLKDRLHKATTPVEVRDSIADFRQAQTDRLVDLWEQSVDALVERAENAVYAAGPNGFITAMGDAFDSFSSAHVASFMRMQHFDPTGFPDEFARQMWTRFNGEQTAYWNRRWDALEATIKGAKGGARKAGWTISNDAVAPIRRVRKETQSFFKRRNKAYEEFFEWQDAVRDYQKLGKNASKKIQDIATGPPKSMTDIKQKIFAEYKSLVDLEYRQMQKMDDTIVAAIARHDKDLADYYASWRKMSRDAKLSDGNSVQDFFVKTSVYSQKRKAEAWQEFWKQRKQSYEQVWNAGRAGIAGLDGNEGARRAVTNIAGLEQGTPAVMRNILDTWYPYFDDVNDDFVVRLYNAVFPESNISKLDDIQDPQNLMDALNIAAGETWSDAQITHFIRGATGDPVRGPRIRQIGTVDGTLYSIEDWTGGVGGPSSGDWGKKFVDEPFKTRAEAEVFLSKIDVASEKDIKKFREIISKGIDEDDLYKGFHTATDSFVYDPSLVYKASDAVQPPYGQVLDDVMQQSGFGVLDDLEYRLTDRLNNPVEYTTKFNRTQRAQLGEYREMLKKDFSNVEAGAREFGMFKRDAGLLNYQRRTNFNTWVGTVFPFEFWTTGSMLKWAIHSIDRPAMLQFYMRARDFIGTAGMSTTEQYPARLEGKIKIKLPFAPDWMNEGWINPFATMLPFDAWGDAFDKVADRNQRADGRAQRLIEEGIAAGRIDEQVGLQAIEQHSGDVWEKAMQSAIQDYDDTGAFDIMSTFMAPHAPISWAYHAANDEKEKIGAFMPISGKLKGTAGALLGINITESKLNLPARIREHYGLPAFDEWDTYRTERMMVSLLAQSMLTYDEVAEAMSTGQGPAYQVAESWAAKEYGGGDILGNFLEWVGFPVGMYPEGEEHYRRLQPVFSEAMANYDKDPSQVKAFYDNHPEWVARTALWDTPEERLDTFTKDAFWSAYSELSTVDKKTLREVAGEDLDTFLSNPKGEMPTTTIATWLQMMGKETIGELGNNARPIEFAPPEIVEITEGFYNYRRTFYPDFYKWQNEYFSYPEKGTLRKEYLDKNPGLRAYWKWRSDFFHRNPRTVPYIDDDFELKYKSPAEERKAFDQQVDFTPIEWSRVLDTPTYNGLLMVDSVYVDLDQFTRDKLKEQAASYGMSLLEFVNAVKSSANK